jgi:tRNA(fMet)-specific endonuclease VapC
VLHPGAPANITLPSPIAVVDTDVVSFLFKRDTRAELYRRHLEGRRPVISAQSLAELHHWPEFRRWGERRRRDFEAFLQGYPVIYPNEEICRLWGEVTARAALAGVPLPATDAWQAVTALYLDAPLVTHNPNHYRGAPKLSIISEAK